MRRTEKTSGRRMRTSTGLTAFAREFICFLNCNPISFYLAPIHIYGFLINAAIGKY